MSSPEQNFQIVMPVFSVRARVFMLLSCIGQRSLSNSGVLEGLLNLLDSLLSPLQQPYAAAQRRTEGKTAIRLTGVQVELQKKKCTDVNLINAF